MMALSAPEWLATFPEQSARAVCLDPPYSTTPNAVRGKDDGAAGTSGSPYRLFVETLRETRRVLVEGGVALTLCDWRRWPDVAYLGSTSGLRIATVVAWTRTRPGTGGLLRTAWDPLIVFSRGTPEAIDRAAVKNVVECNPPHKRAHPYEKPPELWAHVLQRVPKGKVLDPFCGSGSSRVAAESCGHTWQGFDVDPAWCPREDEP